MWLKFLVIISLDEIVGNIWVFLEQVFVFVEEYKIVIWICVFFDFVQIFVLMFVDGFFISVFFKFDVFKVVVIFVFFILFLIFCSICGCCLMSFIKDFKCGIVLFRKCVMKSKVKVVDVVVEMMSLFNGIFKMKYDDIVMKMFEFELVVVLDFCEEDFKIKVDVKEMVIKNRKGVEIKIIMIEVELLLLIVGEFLSVEEISKMMEVVKEMVKV